MKEFREVNPSNARIVIDHRKDKVKFSYPNKKTVFRVCFDTFFGTWILLNLIFIAVNSPLIIHYIDSKVEEEGSVEASIGVNLEQIKIIYSVVLVSVFHIFSIPVLTSYLFSRSPKLLSLMPEISKTVTSFPFSTYYYKKITKLNSTLFTIPTFGNIFLDYKASGEFSKYLYKVEIKEYDFKYVRRNIFRKDNIKEEQQDGDWYANFHFSKIPKKGYLEVFFR